MKVLGVVGSPRKGGNTDILVSEMLKGAQSVGASTDKILLNDMNIKPCQSICSDYCKRTGECRIDDDMSKLYNKLYDSDVIVLGTPVYWYGPSAQLKCFIDRWFPFSHPKFVHRMKGKRAILVAPFEESDASASDPLVSMITKSLNYLQVELFKKLLVTAGEKGAVKQNTEAMNEAFAIGTQLKQ